MAVAKPLPVNHQTDSADHPRLFAPWTVFWVALLLRLAYMTLAHTYRFRAFDFGEHFAFGWEMGRIGRALATGYGFADPFNGHTGPTAWVAPLYPLLIGGIFRIFGVYTLLSAWMLLAINCLLSALMTRTVWEIASRCFNARVAVWSAWIWALYPAAMQYAVRWVWEMTLTAFLFSWVLVLALRMRKIGDVDDNVVKGATVARWALLGLLWGLIALSNPSLLLFAPACVLWVAAGGSHLRRQVAGVALAGLVALACIAPWTARNWLAFHRFVPLRGNLGVELYLGNGPGANGLLMEFDHPIQSSEQANLYRQLGEIEYSRIRGDRAMREIRSNPARFAVLCLERIYLFWAGVPHPTNRAPWQEYARELNYCFASTTGVLGLLLALRRHKPAVWLFAWAFLLLPATYYAVTVAARFRHPLEPLIVILSVYLFQSAKSRSTTPRRPV